MHRLFVFLLISFFLLTSCDFEGPAGPEGPQGPKGPKGPSGPGSKTYVKSFLLDDMRQVDSDTLNGWVLYEKDISTDIITEGIADTGTVSVELKYNGRWYDNNPYVEIGSNNNYIVSYPNDYYKKRMFHIRLLHGWNEEKYIVEPSFGEFKIKIIAIP